MPFTFSVADGIAFGFITYTGIKTVAGRIREVHPVVAILTVLFIVKYMLLG